MSNYATKSNLKNSTGVDTSQLAKKDDLANLKLDIDKLEKLDIDKLSSVPTYLSKLSNVVKKDVVYMMYWSKRLMLLIVVNFLTKQFIKPRAKIFKMRYLILLLSY